MVKPLIAQGHITCNDAICKRGGAHSFASLAILASAGGPEHSREGDSFDFCTVSGSDKNSVPFSFCQPARDVGGDLYYFGPLAQAGPGLAVGTTAVTVGDVSGKVMAAALYMTLARGLLAAAALLSGKAPVRHDVTLVVLRGG